MKLIDKIIKILINFKYKREPFMAWSWGIDDVHEISIISAEYYNDHYKYGVTEKYYKVEGEERIMEDERWKSIELLSELRARYSCFDEKEEPYYRALSLAIASIREKMDADNEEQTLKGSEET